MHDAANAPPGAESSDDAEVDAGDQPLTARVPPPCAGERLDKVLAQLFPAFSRSRLKSWCESGLVRSAGVALAPRTRRNARAGH